MVAAARAANPTAAVARFRRVKVLVAGDLMLDHFVWGAVDRISPEAPVPVVRVTAESRRLGGAANVVHNIRALGGAVVACGVVGADAAGRDLLEELRRIGADPGGIVQSRAAVTTRKTRIIAHQQQVVRLDREDEQRRESSAAARARGFLLAHLGDVDVVVISDYGKGVVTPELLAALAAMRRRRPFPLLIDPEEGELRPLPGRQPADPEPRRGEPGGRDRDPRRLQPGARRRRAAHPLAG